MCKESETGRAESKPVRLKNRKPAGGWQETTPGTLVTADLL